MILAEIAIGALGGNGRKLCPSRAHEAVGAALCVGVRAGIAGSARSQLRVAVRLEFTRNATLARSRRVNKFVACRADFTPPRGRGRLVLIRTRVALLASFAAAGRAGAGGTRDACRKRHGIQRLVLAARARSAVLRSGDVRFSGSARDAVLVAARPGCRAVQACLAREARGHVGLRDWGWSRDRGGGWVRSWRRAQGWACAATGTGATSAPIARRAHIRDRCARAVRLSAQEKCSRRARGLCEIALARVF